MTHTIAITGGSGFIGRHLVRSLARRTDLQLRLLVHRNAPSEWESDPAISLVRGDLFNRESLSELITPGCTLVNLAYFAGATCEENIRACSHLTEWAVESDARRFIHVSTAVVAGSTSARVVDERTPCRPANDYETSKLMIEKSILSQLEGRVEAVLLRPTAVFGPGGKNLLKLADEWTSDDRLVQLVRRSLYGRRRMNAVCVKNVVAAIEFLIDTSQAVDRERFIISDDECPENNYLDVGRSLLERLGHKSTRTARLPLPEFLLAFLLRIVGRSNVNPQRLYSCRKLLDAGFQKRVSLQQGLSEFADWYQQGLPADFAAPERIAA
jgi:nucleoside-diphosphate-sugar epimerase